MNPVLEVAAVLAGYLFCSLAILRLGNLLLSRIGLADEIGSNAEWHSLSWVAGSAAFSLLVFALAAAHFINRWTLMALGITSIASGWMAADRRTRVKSDPLGPLEKAGLALAALFLAIYFVAALSPGQDSDGYRYHLGFPHLYRAAGGLVPIRWDLCAGFPQSVEMLYLCALEFGGFSTARLLHWNFLAALLVGMWSFASHYGERRAGAWSAAVLSASSIVGTTTASASVDTALAAAIFASFHGWMRWRDTQAKSWLLFASIASGFACSIKYTGGTALVVASAFLVAQAKRRRVWVTAVCAAGVCLAPWLIRNWIQFGNPVMPFLNAWFPNPYFLPASEADWIANVRQFNGAKIDSSYPWEIALRGVTPLGFTGPVLLLVPLMLASLGSSLGRWTAYAASITCLPWLLGNPLARFAIPSLPFLVLGIALGMRASLTRRVAEIALALSLSVQAVMDFPPLIERWNKQWVTALKEIPWRGALRIQSPEEYWTRNLPTYPLLRYVDANLPRDARVLSFDEQYQFFTTRVVGNYYGSEQVSSVASMIKRASDPSEWPAVRCVLAQPPKDARYVRLRQQADDAGHPWVIFEIRLQGRRVRRVSASHNPWEAYQSLDGNTVTAWSTKESVRKGMWLMLELDPAMESSSLEFATSLNGRGAVAAGWSGDGDRWEPGGVRCETVDVDDFERRSMGEVKRRGWTHLLVNRKSPWLRKALGEPELWGIRVLQENRGVCLVEIE